MSRRSLIRVGVILAAHGVRGEIKLRSLTDPPRDIFSYGPLTDAAGKQKFALKHRGGKDEAMIVSIDGIADRNAAELLRGMELYITEDRLPEKSDGQWYFSELEGLEARLVDGGLYGRVVRLYNFGAGDIVEIECGNGQKEMLPFKKPFVTDVRPDKGYLVVSPPEYVEVEKK